MIGNKLEILYLISMRAGAYLLFGVKPLLLKILEGEEDVSDDQGE